MSGQIDLDAYAERIGYREVLSPDLETLQGIAEHHVASIPFENCSVLLGHPVELEIEALQDKLLTRKRGGYCFEQNTFLIEVLNQIGFKARPLSARVRMGAPRDFLPARTHLFCLVEADGAEWLMDVGVGGGSLSSPIRFELDIEQTTKHESRRIVREEGKFFHQYLHGGWEDVYEFTGEEMPMVDRQVSNWWTSTHPRSRFKNDLFCALSLPENEKKTILGKVFTHRKGAETLRSWEFEDSDQVMRTLSEEFGICFEPGVVVPCPGV